MTITSTVRDVEWMGRVIAQHHIAHCEACDQTWWEPSALALAAVTAAHEIERHR